MVFTERAETAAVLRGTSHVTTKQRCTPHHFGGYLKRTMKSYSHSFRICEPVWPSGKALAGKRKDLGSIPLRLSVLFKKVVVCGHCLVTLSITSY